MYFTFRFLSRSTDASTPLPRFPETKADWGKAAITYKCAALGDEERVYGHSTRYTKEVYIAFEGAHWAGSCGDALVNYPACADPVGHSAIVDAENKMHNASLIKMYPVVS